MKDKVLDSYLSEYIETNSLEGMNDSQSFERFATHCVISRIHPSDFDIESLVIQSDNDQGIDSISILVDEHLVNSPEGVDSLLKHLNRLDVQFILVQAKTSPRFDSGDMLKFFEGVKRFFEDEAITDESEQFEEYRSTKERIYEKSSIMRSNPALLMYYVTTGQWIGDKILDAVAQAAINDLEATRLFSSVDFVPVDADRLKTFHRQINNRVEADIKFERTTNFPSIENVSEAVIGLLPCKEYLKLITDEEDLLQKSLFYDNVRDYQGENPVNREIIQTIKSPKSADLFALLNNGITIVAQSATRTGDIFRLRDYQIVNGCQTSHILYYYREHLDDNTCVPVKLVVSENQDVTNNVIKATNRQTEVHSEAFESLSDFHKGLESYYLAFPNEDKLYYERRSKQYAMQSVDKRRVISLAAQTKAFVSTFLQEPHSMDRYYGEILKSYRDRLYQQGHSYIPYYVSSVALVKAEEFTNQPKYRNFKQFKYHLIMLARTLSAGLTPPGLTSKKIEPYCENFNLHLSNDQMCLSTLKSAAEIITGCLNEFKPRREAKRRRDFTQLLLQTVARSVKEDTRPAEQEEPATPRYKGVIERYDRDRGFGFIRSDDFPRSIFVHISALAKGEDRFLVASETVCFDIERTPKGIQASHVYHE